MSNDATATLHALIDCLTPIHEAMERFRKGGKDCAREIERIYDALVRLEDQLVELEDEDDLELDE